MFEEKKELWDLFVASPVVKTIRIAEQNEIITNVISNIHLSCMLEPENMEYFITKGLSFAGTGDILNKVKVFLMISPWLDEDSRCKAALRNELSELNSLL